MMFQSARLLILSTLMCYHLAEVNGTARKVLGYIGEMVVLKPEGDPSWTLSRIWWSISKGPVIATYQSGIKRVDRADQFTDRLELNTSTGDLTIKALTAKDSMTYSVELVGSGQNQLKTINIELAVQEPLREPDISVLHSSLDSGTCVIALNCSSLNSKVALSWKPEDGFREHFWSCTGKGSSESVLWSTFSNRNVTFYCIATEGNMTKRSSKDVKCSDAKPSNSSDTGNGGNCHWTTILVTVIFTLAGVFVFWLIIKYKVEIQQHITELTNFITSKFRSDSPQL